MCIWHTTNKTDLTSFRDFKIQLGDARALELYRGSSVDARIQV